jgi:hypothetical protein
MVISLSEGRTTPLLNFTKVISLSGGRTTHKLHKIFHIQSVRRSQCFHAVFAELYWILIFFSHFCLPSLFKSPSVITYRLKHDLWPISLVVIHRLHWPNRFRWWFKSAERHVALLGHIILIPSQPVFVLSPYCCVLSGKATNTNFIVFSSCVQALQEKFLKAEQDYFGIQETEWQSSGNAFKRR